jgi:hypothetical protein
MGPDKASTLLDIDTHTAKHRSRAHRRIMDAFASDLRPGDDDDDPDDGCEPSLVLA